MAPANCQKWNWPCCSGSRFHLPPLASEPPIIFPPIFACCLQRHPLPAPSPLPAPYPMPAWDKLFAECAILGQKMRNSEIVDGSSTERIYTQSCVLFAVVKDQGCDGEAQRISAADTPWGRRTEGGCRTGGWSSYSQSSYQSPSLSTDSCVSVLLLMCCCLG